MLLSLRLALALFLSVAFAVCQGHSASEFPRFLDSPPQCFNFCLGSEGVVCTADFSPVLCGPSTCREQYSNACFAASKGWDVRVDCIQCPASVFESISDACPSDIQPVACGGGKYCQYDNACLAEKAGFDVATECQDGPTPWTQCESGGAQECSCEDTGGNGSSSAALLHASLLSWLGACGWSFILYMVC